MAAARARTGDERNRGLRFTGRQDVRVLQFNYFTKTPGLALQTKFDAAGIRPVRPVSSECVAERLRNENQRAQVGSSRSNLPDSSRAQKCARYERVLAEPALVRDLAAANKVFEALVAKAPVPVTRRGSFGASVAGFGVAGGAIASAANTSSRLY